MSLKARDLQVRLGRKKVLDGVQLEAQAGRVLALIGPNGAGKSTFLRTAAGLIRPAHGTLTIDEQDLHRLSPRERARLVGFVPQEHRIRYPFTVQEVVRMGRYAHRGPWQSARREDLIQVKTALQGANAEHLRARTVTTLSGGERQRVMIARVLAQDPEVYLFDEPTASLDLAQAHHTRRLLGRLAEAGKTVIVVLHDLEEASRIAHRTVLLHEGRTLGTGPPTNVITPENVQNAYGVQAEVSWAAQPADGARIRILDARRP